MQLVKSPDKGCKVFGRQLNPQESKFYTETIFNHLVVPFSQNFINSLMTTDSQGRMDFLAHKISKEIKVNIQINSDIQYGLNIKSFSSFFHQRVDSLPRKF